MAFGITLNTTDITNLTFTLQTPRAMLKDLDGVHEYTEKTTVEWVAVFRLSSKDKNGTFPRWQMYVYWLKKPDILRM